MQFTGADAVALIALAIGLGWIFTGPIGVALAAADSWDAGGG